MCQSLYGLQRLKYLLSVFFKKNLPTLNQTITNTEFGLGFYKVQLNNTKAESEILAFYCFILRRILICSQNYIKYIATYIQSSKRRVRELGQRENERRDTAMAPKAREYTKCKP